MTIRVTIKNEDSRETAVIGVQTVDASTRMASPDTEKKLKGGESTDTYVHSGQDVYIREVQNG